jgi:amino acid adenylation domain-containing protein
MPLASASSVAVRDWTYPPSTAPAELRLDHFLAHRAALSPQRTAYRYEQESLSYERLDGLANALAHQLSERGVGPEVVVAVMMERGLEMPVAFFAVLKAGGAILYLDPAEPPDRHGALLRQAGVRLVLTVGGPRNLSVGDALAIEIDAIHHQAPIVTQPPITRTTGANLAQLLQTSGSTGVAKFVMRTHGMLATQLLYEQAAFRLADTDRHLFKFPPSFRESLLPSLAGGMAVIAAPGAQLDTSYIARLINENKITVVSFVPSALKDLLNEPDIAACKSLRHVSCGGEFMSPEIERRFLGRLTAQLHTTYTMTEADYVSTWDCLPGHGHPDGWLGHETNMSMHIVDEQMRAVPPGELGEIAVSGPALARGYFGDPVATAERFVANPFGPPGSRMYRTGDLGFRHADGGIVYAGRADDQVKIGGLRIDLGEVDTALLALPGVIDAAATAWTSPLGGVRLVGHVVEGAVAVIGPNIRARLARRLPAHMVPSLFCRSERLPRLPNGKLNRRALPPPERGRPVVASDYVAPISPLQRRLAEIWADTLWITEVGIDDNFFDLGGTSLLLMQMRARLNTELAGPLAAADLLAHSTVRSLAAHIQAATGARSHDAHGPDGQTPGSFIDRSRQRERALSFPGTPSSPDRLLHEK